MEDRLQKILARAGIGSRRTCESYISQGRVTVNGKTATLGTKADPVKDRIAFDGKKIKPPEELHYIMLHKPRNVISTVTAPDPRPTVLDLVDYPGRLYPVGRLDIESEGLILLTNDGDLTNKITHPRYGVEKEYRVLVPREPDEKQLTAWRKGVILSDGIRTSPAKLWVGEKTNRGVWLKLVMHEGRKRQIREIGDLLGLPVLRLIRVRMGSLRLGKLKIREWRELTPSEVDSLKNPKTTHTRRKPRGKGQRKRSDQRRK